MPKENDNTSGSTESQKNYQLDSSAFDKLLAESGVAGTDHDPSALQDTDHTDDYAAQDDNTEPSETSEDLDSYEDSDDTYSEDKNISASSADSEDASVQDQDFDTLFQQKLTEAEQNFQTMLENEKERLRPHFISPQKQQQQQSTGQSPDNNGLQELAKAKRLLDAGRVAEAYALMGHDPQKFLIEQGQSFLSGDEYNQPHPLVKQALDQVAQRVNQIDQRFLQQEQQRAAKEEFQYNQKVDSLLASGLNMSLDRDKHKYLMGLYKDKPQEINDILMREARTTYEHFGSAIDFTKLLDLVQQRKITENIRAFKSFLDSDGALDLLKQFGLDGKLRQTLRQSRLASPSSSSRASAGPSGRSSAARRNDNDDVTKPKNENFTEDEIYKLLDESSRRASGGNGRIK